MPGSRQPDAAGGPTWPANPLCWHLCLHVAGDLGDKDSRGQAYAKRQGAVTQAGNNQSFTPPQAIVPGPGNAAGVHHAPPEQPAARRAGLRLNPVSVGPGARQETRTPEPRTSSARASVNDSTYAFVA